jgi:catechol 2,3-dioxygenase-like lactoylglutathione lyase family enzyme
VRKPVPQEATTNGIHHLGLTVPDVIKTSAFFVQILGFREVGSNSNYPAVFLSDGSVTITLWQAENPDIAFPFDRKNVIGLHHVALRVESEDALQDLFETLLDTDDVEVEFRPEPLGKGQSKHMMCYIPGGIRMEFIAPAA